MSTESLTFNMWFNDEFLIADYPNGLGKVCGELQCRGGMGWNKIGGIRLGVPELFTEWKNILT